MDENFIKSKLTEVQRSREELDSLYTAAYTYVRDRDLRVQGNPSWTSASDLQVRTWERFSLVQAFVAGAESVKDGVTMTPNNDQFHDRADRFLQEFESTSVKDGVIIGTFGSWGTLHYCTYMHDALYIAFLKGIECKLKIRLV